MSCPRLSSAVLNSYCSRHLKRFGSCSLLLFCRCPSFPGLSHGVPAFPEPLSSHFLFVPAAPTCSSIELLLSRPLRAPELLPLIVIPQVPAAATTPPQASCRCWITAALLRVPELQPLLACVLPVAAASSSPLWCPWVAHDDLLS
ncbi:hypothetical protein CRG98_018929 [Punica granatum]|uniref:Uncharacterized protein n=1 Tax=Punica granatum TaxID=22663 RepID=A0A2I0JWP4_PUNGR|nr:hypothetical protein CRG98_018929 [Punica granatum]